MVAGGTTAVVGEVYEVDPVTLAALDRLEGCPDLFRREDLPLTDGRTALGYVLQPSARPEEAVVIESGSWRLFQS